jgi:cytochrome c oxidase cbb3-type subunit 2
LLLAWQVLGWAFLEGAWAEAGQAPPHVFLRGQQVYAANCAVCHGVNGDGNGMAAHMFRVRPRDFRQGIFKFRSTPFGSLPTDDDLLQSVTHGLRWTGMVGRVDLPEADRRAAVQYLKTFSPRFATEAPAPAVGVPTAPPKNRELVEQGGHLYRELGCIACHGERGRGDGSAAAGLKDYWDWPTRPSDLTWRPLKRGSRPEDLYLTIATGLSGTPNLGGSLDGRQIWALVYYLDSLVPPERRLPAGPPLGEEPQGWMAVRMGRMMGGMMGRGMPGTP